MYNGKKIIGVCLTLVHNRTRADFVERLGRYCASKDIKIMVFNSVVDYYNNDVYDAGARSVYDAIDYDIIDALIILSENFHNKEVYGDIIKAARKSAVPVVLVDDERGDCISVVKEYKEAYKSVMRHLIRDHGYTDTFFIAGSRENDPVSTERIACYKEVLEENWLEFSDDLVGYGEYWSKPTYALIDRLMEERGKLPRALICANDFMAIAACEKIKEMGLRVPEDVAVTGFDGVPDANYFHPKLTTCKSDADYLVRTCVDAITDALDGKGATGRLYQKYDAVIGSSCGCADITDSYREDVQYLFSTMQEMESHERYMYAWLDKLIENSDINHLADKLSHVVLDESYICLNSNFITSAITREAHSAALPSGKMIVIPHAGSKKFDMLQMTNASHIVPDLDDWINDDSIYILSAIFVVDGEECGYYAVRTSDVFSCAHQLDRISKTINIALNSAMNYLRQKYMRASIENAQLINPITELPNLKGATKWFDDFSADPKNHEMTISVSVYLLPKYKYIYENYGIKDIEEVLRLTAELLQLANPKDCYIAHISEDEFIVINYYKDPTSISDVIQKATSVFFSNVENYNNSRGKEYYVEVNCGCAVADGGWDGTLANYTRLASIELYANRIKSGGGSAVIKDKSPQRDYYNVFNILVERNLFLYHFQPIVNAKNGEIYAYEALMRTDSSVGMTPLQVLDTAKSYKRLYEIEKLTMYNVMERFAVDFDTFKGRKVFINSIPGHFLTNEDKNALMNKYSDYLKYFVFEITEQDSISDDELDSIKGFGGENDSTQIAIDDYGTGHSNIVNLLRYSPHIIKIDRFLIENINKDVNKQMFVRSTIEFARLNRIQVLAEGVETADEMRTVIDFGVDYIQGYYTGRPQFTPITAIDEEIKKEIMDANPLFTNV